MLLACLQNLFLIREFNQDIILIMTENKLLIHEFNQDIILIMSENKLSNELQHDVKKLLISSKKRLHAQNA